METFFAIFPQYGKLSRSFSTVWKTFLKFFHAAMENFFRTDENGLKKPVFRGFGAVGLGLWSGARGAPCEP